MGDSLLQQGLDLMSFGMGTVFVFLTILVTATVLMSRIIGRYFPDASEPEVTTAPTSASAGAPVDSRVLKIIQAALDQHRGRK